MRTRTQGVIALALCTPAACAPQPLGTAASHAPTATVSPASSPVPGANSPPRDAGEIVVGPADGGSNLPALMAVARWHMQREHDPNRLVDAYPQSKPKAFHPVPERRAGAFPGTAFASVAAFSFGRNQDLFPNGCEVLTPEGTLCPDVSAPGVTLSAAQSARLLGLIRSAESTEVGDAGQRIHRPFSRCIEPHLAFVFFDAEHAPVALLEASLYCNGWRSTPAAPGVYGAMRLAEQDAIVGLCEELGLDECWVADPRFRGALEALEAAPPDDSERLLDGVDLDGPLEATTPFEARALCAHSLRDGLPATGSVETPDGRRYTFVDYPACVATFPACRARVRDALACERSLTHGETLLDGGTTSAGASVCAGLDGCLWRFRPAAGKPGMAR